MTRDETLNIFLNQNGWGMAQRTKMASDASNRTYERITTPQKSAILMNSPLSEHPDLFVFFDELLLSSGIRAPQILAKDMENGFLILEDFGDNTFTKLLAQGSDELTLYKKGVDTLITLQKNIHLEGLNLNTYGLEQMLNGVMFLPNWFGKYVLPNGLSESAVSEFKHIWENILSYLKDIPQTLALLDYHVDNLMITPDGDCGVLDFQDARLGVAPYDLMSLLEDERRPVSESTRQTLIDYYFSNFPKWDTPIMRQSLDIIAMQRHTRVIGLFIRLLVRDHKEKYPTFIPFIWELCEKHLDAPLFAEYKKWVENYIPYDLRHCVFTLKEQE